MKEEILVKSELTKKKKARYLNNHINQYNGLARTTKDIRKWLMRKAVTCWIRGDEDMAEWHEKISDEFFEYVKIFVRKPPRLQRS